MNERAKLDHSLEIEEGLGAIFSVPGPSPDFVDDLERELMALDRREARRKGPQPPVKQQIVDFIGWPLARHRWATVGVAVLLALAATLFAVGPQRVWADLQQLLGYVPGVGFVDLEESRVLTAPVSVMRDGVTLRVVQVLAEIDGTTVVITGEGLPSTDVFRGPFPLQGRVSDMRLELPDGTSLAPDRQTTTWPRRETRLLFPPLPADIYRLTLAIEGLPFARAGEAPEHWEVPLALRPVTGELVADLFPEPYVPAGARDSRAGVTLDVVAAVHTPEVTALQVRVGWSEPSWGDPKLHTYDGTSGLRDDLGHLYHHIAHGAGPPLVAEGRGLGEGETAPLPSSVDRTDERTWTLAPVSPSARRLHLSIDEIFFEVAIDEAFTLDLGPNPQPGDSWELNEQFTVAGFPVHVTGVDLERTDDREGREYRLTFEAHTETEGNRRLSGILLRAPMGLSYEAEGGSFAEPAQKPTVAGSSLPDSPFTVTVNLASVGVRGPWDLSWPVPGGPDESAVVAPVTLRPEGVQQTRGPVTLAIDHVTLTDRLTAVRLMADQGPAGGDIRVRRGWNEPLPYLKDDRGIRYELAEGMGWETERTPSETGDRSATLIFEPLQPLARRVTLHVDQAELVIPYRSGFEVTVPRGIDLEPRFEVDAQPTCSEGRDDTLTWHASDPWEVDIRFEAAGCSIHLTEARLEGFSLATQRLALSSEPVQPRPGDCRLQSISTTWATGAAGNETPVATVLDVTRFFADKQPEVEMQHRAVVVFPDLMDGPLPAGRYQVGIDSFRVSVQGPWELTWDLQIPLADLLIRPDELPGTVPEPGGRDDWVARPMDREGEVDAEDWIGALAEADGTIEALRVQGPREVRTVDGASQVVYVANTAFRFDTPRQAQREYEGVVHRGISHARERLYAGPPSPGIEAQTFLLTDPSDDVVYWLVAVSEHDVQLLKVNGPDNASTRGFFDAAVSSLLEVEGLDDSLDPEAQLAALFVQDAAGACGWEVLGESDDETYAWAICQSPRGTAVSAPVVFSWTTGESGTQRLLGVYMPRDGSYYDDDVRQLFPPEVQARIFHRDIDGDAIWGQVSRDLATVVGTVVESASSARVLTHADARGVQWHVPWSASRGVRWPDGSVGRFEEIRVGMRVEVVGFPAAETGPPRTLSAVRVTILDAGAGA